MHWQDKPIFELERSFIEAFERLLRASEAYDSGHLSEAPNLAKEVATFVYDHGATISILSHLGTKDCTAFVDSSKPSAIKSLLPNRLLISNEYFLIDAYIGFDGMGYRPLLCRSGSKLIGFGSWWEGPVLSRYVHASVNHREIITRRELIMYVRNEEGGAHVSGQYRRGSSSDKLAHLMQGEYVDGYMEINGGSPQTSEPHIPAYATVRQIGWELEQTLRNAQPHLTSRANFTRCVGPRMKPV